MQVRLRHEHYKTDMPALTRHLAAQRAAGVESIEVDVVPEGSEPLTICLRTDNLYFTGFENQEGDWFYFHGHNNGGTELIANGSYGSLGAQHNFTVTKAQLDQVGNLRYKYGDGNLTNGQKVLLLHVIVAICEALRFHPVFWKVIQTLKTRADYPIHWYAVHHWNQMSVAGHASVRVHPD